MTTLEELAPQSKVWIYTAERELSPSEMEIISQKADKFIKEWESHGSAVKGFFEIKYNRFLFIYADDQGDRLCGRAMDSSIQFVKELEKELNISLIDRMLIPYKDNNKIITVALPEFQQLISKGEVDENTVVFNGVITEKSQLPNWEVPAKNSWHKQLF